MLCNLFETIVHQASPDYVIYVVGEKFYFFGKQEIAICINLQLLIVILKKSILLDMHHHKTYMYINFQHNRVSKSISQNRAQKFCLQKFATCSWNFENSPLSDMHYPLTDIQADFEINRPVRYIEIPQKEIITTHDRRTDGQTSRTTTISSFIKKRNNY